MTKRSTTAQSNFRRFKPAIPVAFLLLCFLHFNATAQTLIQIGTGSVSPAVGTNPGSGANGASPYGICVGLGAMGKKVQILYTVAQINAAMTAAGFSPGASFIHTVAWDISSNIGGSNYSHAGYTIKMANVAQTSFASAAAPYTGPMTTVWGPTNQQYGASGTGYLITHTLATPFQWDGTSSLFVEVCYTIASVGSASTYGACRRTNTASNQMLYNGGAAINCSTGTFATAVAAIPNMRLNVSSATPCSGAPAASSIASTSVCPGLSTTLSLSGLVGAAGYTYQWKYSATSGSGYAIIPGATNSTYATPTTLPSDPAYYICEVTCTNSGLMTPSSEGTVTVANFLTCYCTPTGATSNSGTRGITNVTLAGASVTLNNTTTVNNVAPYVTLYTTPNPDLVIGSNYSISIKVGSATNEFAAAFIDYNQDGVYTTPAERLGVSASTIAANGTATFNFTVPLTALAGITGMRVVVANTAANAVQCPGTGTYEAEDYRVSITPACTPPTVQASGASLGTSSTTSQNINWSSNGNGDAGVIVVVKESTSTLSLPVNTATYTANAAFGSGTQIGSGNYVVYNGTGSSVTVTGLTLNTSYDYAIYTYNTTGPCYLTPGLTGSFTTDNGPMTYTSSTTVQQTGGVALGTSNAPIVQVQVVTGPGTSPALTLSSLTFNTNGSTNITNDITAARIYYTGTNATFAATTQFGSDITTFPGGATPIVVNGSQTLSPGTNYFWVVYDVSIGATIGNVLDAACTSVNDGSPHAPSVTAPAGNRPITSLASLQCAYSGSSQAITFTTIVGTVSPSPTLVASGSAIDNNNYPNQTIPFDFEFNGSVYNSFGINSNGFIWFGSGTPAALPTFPVISNASANLGGTGTIEGLIVAAGADLWAHPHISASPSLSQINTRVTGTAPNRMLTIEWTGFHNKSLTNDDICWFVGN